jgi:hypothetical protein
MILPLLLLLTAQAPASSTAPTRPPADAPPLAPLVEPKLHPDRADPCGEKETKEERKKQEKEEQEKQQEQEETTGPSVAQITAIAGSATTLVGSVTGLVVAVAAIPQPLSWFGHNQDLQDAQAAFAKDPDAAHLKKASEARKGMNAVEYAAQRQLGVIVTASVAIATGATGLVATIIDVAGGE